jgi:hypothetical protein
MTWIRNSQWDYELAEDRHWRIRRHGGVAPWWELSYGQDIITSGSLEQCKKVAKREYKITPRYES